jgi:hypothetical protein
MAIKQQSRIEAPEEKSRTVGTQSLYRESEAQTIPYSPDYIVPEVIGEKQRSLMEKYHSEGPEVLELQKMKFGQGLPVGLTELNHIDKLREKRAFEASLPPLHDVARLPQRRAMMEAWEHKEWAEREQEILALQEERLELLAHAIETREYNIEAEAEQRVDRVKAEGLAKRGQVRALLVAVCDGLNEVLSRGRTLFSSRSDDARCAPVNAFFP